jgi:hypothetical protein
MYSQYYLLLSVVTPVVQYSSYWHPTQFAIFLCPRRVARFGFSSSEIFKSIRFKLTTN